jgi:LuxR family maltose regulon positive regulatory protein
LHAAEQIWQEQNNQAKLGTLLALRCVVLLWQGEIQKSLEAAYRSLEKLPESEVFWRGVSLLNAAGGELYAGRIFSAQDLILEARALLGASQNIFGILAATGILSEIFFAQGDLEPCLQLNQQILTEAVGDESMLDDRGEASLRLSRMVYEQNDLESAARYADEALKMGEQRANELLQAGAASQLALVRFARGEGTQAQEGLKSRSAQLQSLPALGEIRTVEALLAVRAGEDPGVWLLADHKAMESQKERAAFIRARWQINTDKSSEALAALLPALAQATGQGNVRSQVEANCLIALARYAAGDATGAAESLFQALAIGHEKGFRRIFLDLGAQMAALLRESLPSVKEPALSLYIKSLLQLFSQETALPPINDSDSLTLVEPLSPQEIRVLKLLAAGLSNGDIASELVVSINTVKTHVKSIYRKLNIRSRQEARVVVKELRLL